MNTKRLITLRLIFAGTFMRALGGKEHFLRDMLGDRWIAEHT
jgi:hypothetical protein